MSHAGDVAVPAPGLPPDTPEDDDAAIAVVSLYQKQKRIYPRAVGGWFARWRWALVWLTQSLFYGLPWLSWNGRQAVLFDLAARRFYIGPLVLYPQDFIYLTAILVIAACSLFLFTAVAGRLWCGYACPQTVYTEIFMWVERRIEGDRVARMRLDSAPWSLDKLARKSAKQTVWIAIALWTGFTLVGYFTPIRTLAVGAVRLDFGPWEWFWVLFYGLATYGNAGWLREQVCLYMCPYARFQSAMFDKDTLTVTYDAERGEPRGSRPRKADHRAAGKGDCIDCTLCVQVCPTGIDIRRGLQFECIGCAACVDVCDGVMDKMNYPRGLIRYDTQYAVSHHLNRSQMLRRVMRPRVLIYSGVLTLISVALAASLFLRAPFKVDVVRDRASLARQVDDGRIENIFRLQVMNTTEQAQRYRVSVDGLTGIALAAPADITLGPAEARWVTLGVQITPEVAQSAGPGAHGIHFTIAQLGASNDAETRAELREKSSFIVPR